VSTQQEPANDPYRPFVGDPFTHHYRPHDVYIGTLLSALTALDGGITTVVDNLHNARSREHSKAAVEAMVDVRIRAVHAAGPALSGRWGQQCPTDVLRGRASTRSTRA